MAALKFADSLARLGTESAFVVLARAQALAAQGQDIINLGIGQPDFRDVAGPSILSRRAAKRCAMAITAIPPPMACPACARRWPPICTAAMAPR